jgi:phage-related protein
MMNYVIINGKKSTLIQGLMISTLPSISKPLMRTQIEEIDGRDGDIVTPLGYSAYDKEFTIGLYGKYDVDEVIKFFDTEGQVIFSNEPDKFYYFKLIEQIDFEKLIRFKTATVTFHCQPFKYSAIDDEVKFSVNQLYAKAYDASKNGVTVDVTDGIISVKGTATGATEFYFPLNEMPLDAGDYTIKATTEGLGEDNVSIRVIGSVPSDDDSLGGGALPLEESGTASMTAELDAKKTFYYMWMSITSGAVVDFRMRAEVLDDDLSGFTVFNRGNTFSRPILTIYGQGDIHLYINGEERFLIALDGHKWVTLDGAEMNAYKGDTLMNRYVAGDYNNLTLTQGTNHITWTGSVTDVVVANVSRWV